MNAQPILELQSARVSIQNVEVLRQFSLRIEAGQMVGLIGRNGAGKTTVMRTLMGHLPLQAGQLFFGGQDMKALQAHDRAEGEGKRLPGDEHHDEASKQRAEQVNG